MKTKSTILGLLLAVAPFLVKAQNCDAFFPYKKGMVIEQQSFNPKNKLTGTVKQKVTDVTNTAKGKQVDFASEYFDAKGKLVGSSNFSITCKNGVITVDMRNYLDAKSKESFSGANVTMEGTPLEMPSNLSAGMTLPEGTLIMKMQMGDSPIPMNMDMNMRIFDRKVEGTESVTTPAGTFNCFKLSQSVEMKMMFTVSAKSIEFYSKEFGMVRSESYDSKGKLTGYTVLSKME